MGYFQDILAQRRKLGQPMVLLSQGLQPMQPILQGSAQMREKSPLSGTQAFYSVEPKAQPEQQQPVVDSSNAIGSLAQILGPTPAEREAQLNKLERGRQQMAMWTGLFDGLRQLGNLYYTSKGARPQHYNDPYTEVDKTYARNKQTLDDLTAYNRQYAQQLYALQRQAGEDQRKDLLAQAQANYYDTRDEVARMKAENDRLKTEKYIELQDGRIAKMNTETGRIEALTPLQEEEIRSRINKNNKQASIIGAPVTTTTDDGKGNTKTSTKVIGSGGGRKPRRNSQQNTIKTGVNWKTRK